MQHLSSAEDFSKKRLTQLSGSLSGAEKFLGSRACVYATGSFGRLEANLHSDLDLFIVGFDGEAEPQGERKRLFSHLNEICVQAEIIRAARELKLPELDGDGKYLDYHSVQGLIDHIGASDDDAKNTLTARLLLFLESRPLLGHELYDRVIDHVLRAYWRDFKGHEEEFVPAYLANDILRLWRTFCVNYEARTQSEPEQKKIDRKIKNYKLKHSRMITCFSALAYLLKIYVDEKTVTPDDAIKMTRLTPARRITTLADSLTTNDQIKSLMDCYDTFLANAGEGKTRLEERFRDSDSAEKLRKESQRFGELMFEVLKQIGGESRFFRLLVV